MFEHLGVNNLKRQEQPRQGPQGEGTGRGSEALPGPVGTQDSVRWHEKGQKIFLKMGIRLSTPQSKQ